MKFLDLFFMKIYMKIFTRQAKRWKCAAASTGLAAQRGGLAVVARVSLQALGE
ncbi:MULTISPECIES: hypothetical protein [Pseudomonas]|uniref:hypothetical protein n=1 Tax=Pseudomonas TaxID=286 RepID=UPI0012FEEFF7|nr:MULTISPECIES: hypothetical protein [Pseudomonas putida group]EKT4456175.1 hypothetical protein [Pseudomonas putida]EKT4495781.1 hypothetical protein [Pseudomonas putida]EKT4513195.1 hypothetical protein [Pseudomonas putida]EKT8866496.1 hypothetical protein [Pseudomonas putida]MDD2016130.1 hypothetical protein [Pseudomonas putida]